MSTIKRWVGLALVGLALAGCSAWSSKDTETAGKVFRCVQSCASACMREFQQTCPVPEAARAKNVTN